MWRVAPEEMAEEIKVWRVGKEEEEMVAPMSMFLSWRGEPIFKADIR